MTAVILRRRARLDASVRSINSGTDPDASNTIDPVQVPSDNRLITPRGRDFSGLIEEIWCWERNGIFVERVLAGFSWLRNVLFGWYRRSK